MLTVPFSTQEETYINRLSPFVRIGRNPSSYRAATGQESYGRNVNPGFIHPQAGKYRLTLTSSLIDAGVLIPGINDD